MEHRSEGSTKRIRDETDARGLRGAAPSPRKASTPKILARERIAPYRKDVLIKSGKVVCGGDATRKRKVLEKQKQGKARAKKV